MRARLAFRTPRRPFYRPRAEPRTGVPRCRNPHVRKSHSPLAGGGLRRVTSLGLSARQATGDV